MSGLQAFCHDFNWNRIKFYSRCLIKWKCCLVLNWYFLLLLFLEYFQSFKKNSWPSRRYYTLIIYNHDRNIYVGNLDIKNKFWAQSWANIGFLNGSAVWNRKQNEYNSETFCLHHHSNDKPFDNFPTFLTCLILLPDLSCHQSSFFALCCQPSKRSIYKY